jgi:hypothetical protein
MIGEVNAGGPPMAQDAPLLDQHPEIECLPDDLAEGMKWDEYQDVEGYSALISSCNADLWLYRDRTMALLWRYMRLAVEAGRLPSLLGREFFRARVSPYSVQTFEDTVIFVHDVECCLRLLDAADKILIAMLGMEQYTQAEAAQSLRCTQRTIGRHYSEALDHLSEIFLKRELLTPLPEKNTKVSEACQEAKTGEFLVSGSV